MRFSSFLEMSAFRVQVSVLFEAWLYPGIVRLSCLIRAVSLEGETAGERCHK